MQQHRVSASSPDLLDHAVTSALPPRQLPLRDLTLQSIRGHTDAIAQVRTHPSQPVAITIDVCAKAMLWSLSPLAALGLLTDLLQGAAVDAVQVRRVMAHLKPAVLAVDDTAVSV